MILDFIKTGVCERYWLLIGWLGTHHCIVKDGGVSHKFVEEQEGNIV